jgi:hypothetical protein
MLTTHAHTGSALSRADKSSTVIREAAESLRSQDSVHVLTADGLNECLQEPALYRRYKSLLTEGMSADTAEAFGQLCDNFQISFFREASLAGIQPMSFLTMPMLRKAFPKIGIKEGIPTEAVKTPKFTVSTLVPFIKDAVTGAKLALPNALRGANGVAKVNSSQLKVAGTAFVLPLAGQDVMPAGCPVTAGFTLDPVFSIIGVDIVVADGAGANAQTQLNVPVFAGQAETRQGNFRFTVTGVHSSGNTTSDTVFGWVDFGAGTVTAASLSTGATALHAQITKIYVSGKIETTANKQSTKVGFDISNQEIHIGTGEHFDADLPMEWLQDQLAMYNIDGTLKVVDIMTEVVAQKLDLQGLQFLQDAYTSASTDPTQHHLRTFDIHPTGNYTGTPTEWLSEIRRVIDNMAQTMRNATNFSGGQFVLFGNPLDINVIPGINWIFTASGEQERDGTNVNYSLGAISGQGNRYTFLSSQNFAPGSVYMIFIPGQVDFRTFFLYLYTFNVERSSSGFVSPTSPNTPSILMTQRALFQQYTNVIGRLDILHNTGSLPA